MLNKKLQDRVVTDNIKDFIPLEQGIILAKGVKAFDKVDSYNVKVAHGNPLIPGRQSYDILTNVVIGGCKSSGQESAELKEGDPVLIGYVNGDKNSPYIVAGGGTTKTLICFPSGSTDTTGDTESTEVETNTEDLPKDSDPPSATTMYEVDLSNVDVKAIINNLPENLSMTRRVIVESALSLVGKVDYFWGGRWHKKGTCSEWGELKMVTAPDSKTSNTMQPYGLDCSGFTDWAYFQAGINLEGGATWHQKSLGSVVSWENALPGDLAFNKGCTHVGIYVGTDKNGQAIFVEAPSPGKKVRVSGKESGLSYEAIKIKGV